MDFESLPENLRKSLAQHAAKNGRSMEEELVACLESALRTPRQQLPIIPGNDSLWEEKHAV